MPGAGVISNCFCPGKNTHDFLPGQNKHSAELAINFEIQDGTEIGLEEAGIRVSAADIGLEEAEIGDRAKRIT